MDAAGSVLVVGAISRNEGAGSPVALVIAPVDAACALFLASRRQPNTWLTLTPCALATAETLAPGALASARISSFAVCDQMRRVLAGLASSASNTWNVLCPDICSDL